MTGQPWVNFFLKSPDGRFLDPEGEENPLRGPALYFQQNIDLDRGITAAVENFASVDVDDGGHVELREESVILG